MHLTVRPLFCDAAKGFPSSEKPVVARLIAPATKARRKKWPDEEFAIIIVARRALARAAPSHPLQFLGRHCTSGSPTPPAVSPERSVALAWRPARPAFGGCRRCIGADGPLALAHVARRHAGFGRWCLDIHAAPPVARGCDWWVTYGQPSSATACRAASWASSARESPACRPPSARPSRRKRRL